MGKLDDGSPVWIFFEKINGDKEVKCRKCGKTYKYCLNTSVMITHLRSDHPDDLRKAENERKGKNGAKNEKNSRYDNDANSNLIMALSTSNVPFRFVKNEYFKKFCLLLNPDHIVMSPDAIRRKLAENSNKYILEISKKVGDLEKCFIACDGWDGRYENVSLYALFVYFVDKDFCKQKLVWFDKEVTWNKNRNLQFLGIQKLDGKSTAENIGNLISKLIRLYGIDFCKIMGGITDAASNLKSFLNRNDLYHIHCAAHSISLILEEASAIPKVAQVLAKVNRLAAHLSRSKTDRKKFRDRSAALKTKGRIPLPFSVTRWAGCVMLAVAYLEHYQSISALDAFQQFLLDDNEKKVLNHFIEMTTPFLETIHNAESDATYCSEIVPQYASLYEFVSGQNQKTRLVKLLTSETLKRYSKYLTNDVALLAVYCDPRFAYLDGVLKTVDWEDIERNAVNYCESSREVRPADATGTEPPAKKSNNQNTFFSRFLESKRQSQPTESVRTEIVNYEAIIMAGRPSPSSCPLLFWKSNGARFPQLSRLARHVLCSPQSSAQVERLFSRCGELVSSSRRNRLSTKTMNDLLLNASLGALKKLSEEVRDKEESETDEDSDDDIGEDVYSMWPRNATNRRSSSAPPSL
ncbi:hypothetical protein B9Z55_026998 [Caenorhabditis nigoni]|uniref:BED-type domain-containing protein n=2 Tax=Caenorhabditis nigoni TaxID=1611254 RepID=A0A2G5SIW7_9PELO|nr:hypothetical protein B9Z55_026998 [Caenorhabditis nigoni]